MHNSNIANGFLEQILLWVFSEELSVLGYVMFQQPLAQEMHSYLKRRILLKPYSHVLIFSYKNPTAPLEWFTVNLYNNTHKTKSFGFSLI